MPRRFEDYEAELLRSTKYTGQRQHGYRKSSDSSSIHYKNNTTSGPTSTSTSRSSYCSTMGYNMINAIPATYKTPPPPPSQYNRPRSSQIMHTTNPFLHSIKSDQSTNHDIRRNQSAHATVTPTASIQEWAHQVHIQQRRRYEWCSDCYPKSEPLQVPTEKAIKKVRIQRPTHCYE